MKTKRPCKIRKQLFASQSGIALMIVLAAITVLTAAATEFAYNTNVNYNLALNGKERLQAYFLAESAIKLMELELKLEKELRSSISSSPMAGMITGSSSGPLCQQFPLSTALIRSMFLGQMAPAEAVPEGGEEGGAPTEEPEVTEGMPAAFVGGMQREAAKEFLDFEGDLEGLCADEAAKFNLNMFFGKDPLQEVLSGSNSYDRSKQMLISLLARPELKKLFSEDSEREISDIARNIADWVDTNDRMNEMGGTSTGSEGSLYPVGVSMYEVKNGKYLTLDELYKVANVTDDWFAPLKENFTIYGGDKVNVCIAPDEMVAAMIIYYVTSNSTIPQINPADKTRMANLVSVVQNGCTGLKPDVNEIANALNSALGVAATTAGITTKFSDMITTDSRYYSLVGRGIVGDTEVKITAVLDTAEAQPSRWRFVYWRVE